MRTIFHVSDVSKWELAIKNAIHMLNYGKDTKTDIVIEFMVNGPAVTPLNLHDETGEPIRTALQDLVKRGVNVAISQNTLRHLGLGEQRHPLLRGGGAVNGSGTDPQAERGIRLHSPLGLHIRQRAAGLRSGGSLFSLSTAPVSPSRRTYRP